MDDIEAGVALDTLIAERCMGWHEGKGGAINAPGFGYEWPAYWYDAHGKAMAPRITDHLANLTPWSPRTDWAAAALVIDWLIARYTDVERDFGGWKTVEKASEPFRLALRCGEWVCECGVFEGFGDGEGDKATVAGAGATPLLAICHAAQAALEGSKDAA